MMNLAIKQYLYTPLLYNIPTTDRSHAVDVWHANQENLISLNIFYVSIG